MNTTRIVFLLVSFTLVGASYYLSTQGVWGESRDLDRSVRLGGPLGHSVGRIK